MTNVSPIICSSVSNLFFAFRGSQWTIWHPWKIVLGVQSSLIGCPGGGVFFLTQFGWLTHPCFHEYLIYITCLYVEMYMHKSLNWQLFILEEFKKNIGLSIYIPLICVDLRFQLNLTHVHRFGNAHVMRFSSTNTRAVVYLRGHIEQEMIVNKIEKIAILGSVRKQITA